MKLEIIKFEKEDVLNVILGRAPVPKVIDRINDAFTTNLPDLKFGLAFQHRSSPDLSVLMLH